MKRRSLHYWIDFGIIVTKLRLKLGLTIPLWAVPLLIFCLRIGDCSIGKVRVISTIRGYRLISPELSGHCGLRME
jgi:hypothetical protein